jgi:hypothetical protein
MFKSFSEHNNELKIFESNNLYEKSNKNVFKGLGICLGIYVFFLIENIMHLCQNRKKRVRQSSFFSRYLLN